MELFQLQQFVTIAESETMVDAAKKLYLSQPTLSRNLTKLESDLGCKLFGRKHNRMTLTAYGEVVYQHARNIQSELQDMHNEIKANMDCDAHHLRIGFFFWPYAAYAFFAVAARNPSISFEFTNTSEEDLRSGLRDGEFDMVVHTSPISFPGISTETFGWEQVRVYFPRGYMHTQGDHFSTDDLRNLPSILIPTGLPGYSEWYVDLMHSAGVKTNCLLYEDAEEHLRHRTKSSHAFLSTDMLARFLAQGNLMDYADLLGIDGARREIFISYASNLPEQKARIIKEFRSAKSDDMGALLSYYIFRSDQSNISMRYATSE